MFTRRNWLLRCSILINIAVLLYICSHVMIGSGNLTLGPAYVIQEDYAVKSPQSSAAIIRTNAANVALIQQSMDADKQTIQQQQQQHQAQEIARDTYPESQLDNDSNQVRHKINFLFVFFFILVSSYLSFVFLLFCLV